MQNGPDGPFKADGPDGAITSVEETFQLFAAIYRLKSIGFDTYPYKTINNPFNPWYLVLCRDLARGSVYGFDEVTDLAKDRFVDVPKTSAFRPYFGKSEKDHLLYAGRVQERLIDILWLLDNKHVFDQTSNLRGHLRRVLIKDALAMSKYLNRWERGRARSDSPRLAAMPAVNQGGAAKPVQRD